MTYASKQEAVADGRITLYQRADVRDGVWQCRIPMKGVRGYIKRSTKETDFERAKTAAIKLLGQLEQREAQNQPLRPQTFKAVAASFLREAETRWKEGRSSQGRYELIKGTLKRYFLPYFGKRDITLIKKKDMMDYRAWRQNYWCFNK